VFAVVNTKAESEQLQKSSNFCLKVLYNVPDVTLYDQLEYFKYECLTKNAWHSTP